MGKTRYDLDLLQRSLCMMYRESISSETCFRISGKSLRMVIMDQKQIPVCSRDNYSCKGICWTRYVGWKLVLIILSSWAVQEWFTCGCYQFSYFPYILEKYRRIHLYADRLQQNNVCPRSEIYQTEINMLILLGILYCLN